MAKLLEKKVGQITILDAGLIAVAKAVEERVLAKFIGNGTLFSGAVKGVAGSVLSGMVGGKIGSIIGTALIVDAGEDIVNFMLPSVSMSSLRTSPSNQSGRQVM